MSVTATSPTISSTTIPSSISQSASTTSTISQSTSTDLPDANTSQTTALSTNTDEATSLISYPISTPSTQSTSPGKSVSRTDTAIISGSIIRGMFILCLILICIRWYRRRKEIPAHSVMGRVSAYSVLSSGQKLYKGADTAHMSQTQQSTSRLNDVSQPETHRRMQVSRMASDGENISNNVSWRDGIEETDVWVPVGHPENSPIFKRCSWRTKSTLFRIQCIYTNRQPSNVIEPDSVDKSPDQSKTVLTDICKERRSGFRNSGFSSVVDDARDRNTTVTSNGNWATPTGGDLESLTFMWSDRIRWRGTSTAPPAYSGWRTTMR